MRHVVQQHGVTAHISIGPSHLPHKTCKIICILISRRHLCCPPCGAAKVCPITELQWACQPAARRFFEDP